jgi:glutathione S-transferase
MWSASIGAPRSISRSIEAMRGEPGAVSIRRVRSRNSGRGGNPCFTTADMLLTICLTWAVAYPVPITAACHAYVERITSRPAYRV